MEKLNPLQAVRHHILVCNNIDSVSGPRDCRNGDTYHPITVGCGICSRFVFNVVNRAFATNARRSKIERSFVGLAISTKKDNWSDLLFGINYPPRIN